MIREALQNLSNGEADEAERHWRSAGAVVERIRQADGRWTVAATFPDRAPRGGGSAGPSRGGPAPPAAAATAAGPDLGVLSRRFESNGDPGAVGRDSTGGFSYGEYQIATETGTMDEFLDFLGRTFPDLAGPLRQAGGAAAARDGTEAFKGAWKGLAARDPAFADAQHAFLQATHYEPFADRLAAIDCDIRARSAALRNVAWSVCVQHGPNNSVFHNALAGRDPAGMDDHAIIDAVYDERSKVEQYFSRSTAQVQEAVRRRFDVERREALAMLA